MVTFDATMPGTPAATWQTAIAERELPPLDLDADRVVIIAAHPDDETLGAGGLIAAASQMGIPVEVVVVTDGGASHPDSPTHRPEQLVAARAAEVRAAVAVLAPHATVTVLGYPDGQTSHFRMQITADLARFVTGDHTLVVAPWRGDGHRDHRVIGEIAASLSSRLLEYPIWMWHWASTGDLPWGDAALLDIDAELKSRALDCHLSQVAPLSEAPGDEAMLIPDFLANFRTGQELFIVTTRLSAAYFDDLYARHDDPWGFETRWYEQRKRAITLASLPAEHYPRALEIGCSTGLTTIELASRTDDLLAVDISEAAVARAKERVPSGVDLRTLDVTTDFPAGEFDLVLLSEVGYYFSEAVLDDLLDAIEAGLSADGTLLACHCRHPVDGYLLSGDAVHERIGRRDLVRLARHEEEDFVLEVFARNGASVARTEGML